MNAFLEELRAEAWAMDPRHLTALAALAEAASRGDVNSRMAIGFLGRRADRDDDEDLYTTADGVATIKVSGVLMTKKPEWYSWLGIDATETPRIKKALEAAAADDEVESIALHICSPGGNAQGVSEVADAIASSPKTVTAVCEGLCASGAYWLASAASSISATKDCYVGSIGVYSVAVDSSKAAEAQGYKVHVIRSGEHKGMGIGGAPITDAQIAAEQELVDSLAKLFKSAVAKGRKHALDDVDAVATGQTWLAGSAKKKGLVDDVESVSSAFSRLNEDDDQDDEENPMATKPGKNTPKAQDTAAEEGAPAADERAKLAELKAAFPKDLAFAVAQFEAGATVGEAKAAYADILEEKLAASEKSRAELEEKSKKAPAAAAAKKPAPEAGEHVTFAAGGAEGGEESDFIAKAKALVAESGGKLKLHDAMSRVARKDPSAHEDWLNSKELIKTQAGRRYDRTNDRPAGR